MDRRQEELSKFLRARRAALTPTTVEGDVPGRRRTPGLRREEVASLANVSATWYTWLEQGRNIQMSRATLERIGQALRLSPSDRQYLFSLALKTDHHPELSIPRSDIEPGIQAALDNFTCNPAFLTNARHDVLAFNRLANVIFELDTPTERFPTNQIWRLFTDPERRKFVVNWRQLAIANVGVLRVNYGSRIGDPRFEELLEALRGVPEFVEIWEDRGTAPLGLNPVLCHSKTLGRLNVCAIRVVPPTRPDDTMVIFAPSDAKTAAVLLKQATGGS